MHVYLHVPFCRRRCTYCDFAIAVRKAVPSDRYVRAIASEWDVRADLPSGPLDTVYLGGGTPSLLEAAAVTALLDEVRARFGIASEAEVTLEANPDDVRPKRVAAWLAAGVNRVSLGVQSLDDGVLAWMHRPHGADQSLAALGVLRTAGVPSVSADVIFGLPDTLHASPVSDAIRLLDEGVDHLAAYGLTVEPHTPVAKWIARGETRPPPDPTYAREFLDLHHAVTGAGFEHYEVSNYARPGRRSRHNRAYWTGRPYVGVGPSAHSFNGRVRRWNLREWAAYDREVGAGRDPIGDSETLDRQQRELETLYLGLRTEEGAPRDGSGPLSAPRVARAVEAGWLEPPADRLRATPEGWLRLDELVSGLTTLPEGG